MERIEQVERLMMAFAERTGLVGDVAPDRYLWTDAFAVCNYLSLYLAGDDDAFIDRARDLVAQVHDVLGAYGGNDARSGWLGGMSDEEHSRSPTGAGLRIGKSRPERGPGEAFDDRAEWDRDGQYFHYLTRWIYALQRMASVTVEDRYHRWAVELAHAAFNGFVHRSHAGGVRMYWKMSVDLDRPLVPSMGQHDPLDGWVTTLALAESDFADEAQRRELIRQASVYLSMFSRESLVSADPLGIGGLLVDAWRLSCISPSQPHGVEQQRTAGLIDAAAAGLAHIERQFHLDDSPSRRLGFRELGLCIGIRAAQKLASCPAATGPIERALRSITDRVRIADLIERTWMNPEHRNLRSWTDHLNINEVMLATSLAPEGYLGRWPDN